MTLANARLQAADWARDILSQDPLILDTETTGLDTDAEICQIAIIDADGKTLLDTLVKPTCAIPYSAVRIHGITDAMAALGSEWLDVSAHLLDLLANRHVVIYNASYDTMLLRQTQRAHQLSRIDYSELGTIFSCAMLQYAKFYGAWNDYRDDWAWQKLDVAIHQQGLDVPDAPAHSALGDCLRTLALVKCMAGAAGEAVPS